MPMLLDRNGEQEDHWPRLADDAPLPDQGHVLVPMARLDEALAADGLHIGVEIANDTDPATLAPHFARLGLISVVWPSFADGRGFSVGQCLRDIGYAGRLRASGPIIVDQFAYLLACGFDEADIADSVARRQPVEQWLEQVDRVPFFYQRGRSGRTVIPDARGGAHAEPSPS